MGERSGVVACFPTSGPKVRVVKWAPQQSWGGGKIPQSPITGKLVGKEYSSHKEGCLSLGLWWRVWVGLRIKVQFLFRGTQLPISFTLS